ncbi:MAG: rod shape-determining protein RodA [Candidatus Limnocylindrales bacterium]
MGTLRVQPARLGTLGSRAATGTWGQFDLQLAFYAVALAIVGLLMAYTNSSGAPLEAGSIFTRGLMWLAMAIVVFTLATAFDYRWLADFAWPVYALNVFLLALTLVIGTGVAGVSRWVTVFGVQFQFSELAKILMIVVLANFLAGRKGKVRNLTTMIGAGLLVAPPLALVLIQPDLGTSLVFGAILFGVLFLGGASLRWLFVAAIGVIALFPVVWFFILKDYQQARLISFLDPAADPLGSGYQIIQSQIAVGSGGLFGKGLTNGTQTQLEYLPVQSTDFVNATLAEELGFIGCAVVLILFAALLWRVLLIGWRSRDPFGLIFCAGVASMLVFQLLVNFGMVLGIMPITGIPMPFITHGGASLISLALGLGIVRASPCARANRHGDAGSADPAATDTAPRPLRHHALMRIAEFALERYFARWEFSVRWLLCASDVEGYPMGQLLALAEPDARGLWADLRLGYTESTGHPLLRAEIASLYETASADDVLVFAGAEEAIFCLLNVLMEPGRHAIVVWPGYQSLHEVARAAGADVTLHELREADGWALDVERMKGAMRPETSLIVVNAPHNPTGALPTRAEWRALTDLAAESGAHLLSDEVYRFLEFDPDDRLTAGVDAFERGVSLGVMSKSFAMAGLRIGWLATHDRALLARCAAFKDYTTICSAAPSEILALIALRGRDRVLERSREIVARNVSLLDAFFTEHVDQMSWIRPRGGSIGFPKLLHEDSETFAAELVERRGVLLLPGSVFGYPGNHVRIGFGREDLPQALPVLASFLAERSVR